MCPSTKMIRGFVPPDVLGFARLPDGNYYMIRRGQVCMTTIETVLLYGDKIGCVNLKKGKDYSRVTSDTWTVPDIEFATELLKIISGTLKGPIDPKNLELPIFDYKHFKHETKN